MVDPRSLETRNGRDRFRSLTLPEPATPTAPPPCTTLGAHDHARRPDAPAPGILRPPRPGSGPGPPRPHPGTRHPGKPDRGPPHRGRGIRGGGRPRLARLPRPHPAQRRHVRPARTRVRLLHLRHVALPQHGLRTRGLRERCPAARGEIVEGAELARKRRFSARNDKELAKGPARLATALDIDRALDGTDVCAGPDAPLSLLHGTPAPSDQVRNGPRTGVSGEGASTPGASGSRTIPP